jgi:hypothetical protein
MKIRVKPSTFLDFGPPRLITKLCRQQAEVMQNHENANVRNSEHGEARHRKYKRLKHAGCQAYDQSSY